MTLEELKKDGWKVVELYTWLFSISIVTLKRDNETMRVKVNHGIVID